MNEVPEDHPAAGDLFEPDLISDTHVPVALIKHLGEACDHLVAAVVSTNSNNPQVELAQALDIGLDVGLANRVEWTRARAEAVLYVHAEQRPPPLWNLIVKPADHPVNLLF